MQQLPNRILMIVFFLITYLSAAAQIENINTDRPDQSDGVYTISKNSFQLENGIVLAKETVLNNFMLRYGLTKSTEVRVGLDAGKEYNHSGLQPVSFSFKQRLIAQNKLLPAITLVGAVTIESWASKAFKGNKAPVDAKLAFENELSKSVSIGYNIGAVNNFKTLSLSFGISYSPLEKVSTFLEYYALLPARHKSHYIDAGIMYLLSSTCQFDVAVGQAIFAAENEFFASAGVSYWFH